MNSIKSQAKLLAQQIWRRKWLCVAVAWAVSTAGWIGTAFVPTKYESTARVYLNADPVLTPLLRGLAAETDPTRHLDFMQRTLLSRPNLEQLARLTDLDVGVKTPAQKEALFKRLASDVEIRPITTNLLTIGYRDSDPKLAKNVVQSLLTIFGEKTAGSSRTEMDSAQRFLDEEIASYTDQLRAAEKRRADLARQYPDIVSNRAPDAPAGGEDSGTRLDRARSAVVRLKGELDDAVTKRNSLRQELTTIPPMLSVDRAPQVVVNNGREMSPDEARLAELRKNLDSLRLKYTDQHPDVIATRQAIAQVQAEMKAPSHAAGARGGANKTEIANTVYDQLKVKLVDAEGAVAAAQQRLAQAQADEARIEKIAQSAPGVLQQAQDLDRDYTVLKKNYEELVARREAAQIAHNADTRTEAIQFRIVDPPQVPVLPAAPNRPLLVSLALLLGVGAGLATPVAVAQLDRSFATLGQLRNLGVPILGSVSRLSLGAERRRTAIQLAGVCASAFVLIAVYGTLLALSLNLRSVGLS
ncbi:MAG TPA: XrtA system polysaccharide chain length determinant [Stellaceae bacterium]|jgi:polysaccharide chain length determinant protein (PEP-CTERM system associated)